jgi:hypothetical protein
VAVGSDLSVPLAEEGWWAGDLGSGDERAGIAGGRGGVEDEGAPAADVEKDIEEKRFAQLLRVWKMTAVCLFEFPLVWCGSCSEV